MAISVDKIRSEPRLSLTESSSPKRPVLMGIKSPKNPISTTETLSLEADGKYHYKKKVNGKVISDDVKEAIEPTKDNIIDNTKDKTENPETLDINKGIQEKIEKPKKTENSEKPKAPNKKNPQDKPIEEDREEDGVVPDYDNEPVDAVAIDIIQKNKKTPNNIPNAIEEKSSDTAKRVASTFVNLTEKVNFANQDNDVLTDMNISILKKAYDQIRKKLTNAIDTIQETL